MIYFEIWMRKYLIFFMFLQLYEVNSMQYYLIK